MNMRPARLVSVLQRARLRHRVSAFASALRVVDRRGAFLARETLFYPLRPLAIILARVTGRSPADIWASLPSTATYRIRGSDQRVIIRHGTPDVFLLFEVLSEGGYDFPEEVRTQLAATDHPTVVDLGANIGIFGCYVRTQFPTAKFIAFEPDPANLRILRRVVSLEKSAADWRVVAACAGTRDGEVAFAGGQFAVSRIASDSSPAPNLTVPVYDVFPSLAGADLVKIDIEGAEWPILKDERLCHLDARAIVLEYHEWGCSTDDPRAAAVLALGRAGYHVGHVRETSPGYGVIWAWREHLTGDARYAPELPAANWRVF